MSALPGASPLYAAFFALLLFCPAGVDAQRVSGGDETGPSLRAADLAPSRLRGPASLASARLPMAPDWRAQDLSEASLPRIAAGTLVGGALGAAAVAAVGALVGSAFSADGYFISPSMGLAVLGATVGYPFGAAEGASRAASTGCCEVRPGDLIAASIAGAAVGGVLWNRIGEHFDSSRDSGYASWYAGAATGIATHTLITTLSAQRAVRKARRPASNR